ncbi:transcriptional repressor [bacterium]|nr:transcriptional repressor [bacterium]
MIARCRDAGLKITPQRLEVMKAMTMFDGHPSAEEIHAVVLKTLPTVSLDTIYRTLATFQEHGLIGQVAVTGGSARFDPNIERHHHFVCTSCGRVIDFYWPEFDEMIPPETARELGSIISPQAELRGICKHCQKNLQ